MHSDFKISPEQLLEVVDDIKIEDAVIARLLADGTVQLIGDYRTYLVELLFRTRLQLKLEHARKIWWVENSVSISHEHQRIYWEWNSCGETQKMLKIIDGDVDAATDRAMRGECDEH